MNYLEEFDKRFPSFEGAVEGWLSYENVCSHDDGLLCEHRRDLLKDFLVKAVSTNRQGRISQIDIVSIPRPPPEVNLIALHKTDHDWDDWVNEQYQRIGYTKPYSSGEYLFCGLWNDPGDLLQFVWAGNWLYKREVPNKDKGLSRFFFRETVDDGKPDLWSSCVPRGCVMCECGGFSFRFGVRDYDDMQATCESCGLESSV